MQLILYNNNIIIIIITWVLSGLVGLLLCGRPLSPTNPTPVASETYRKQRNKEYTIANQYYYTLNFCLDPV